MAEVFATVAGVASVIDVALRACSVLYSSLHYLKEAPELSQRLRQTVQSVESILRCLNDFIAVYRRQQASTGLPGCLPDAVNHEVVLIKAELDALSKLLPAPGANGQIRRRVKWVLDRKRVDEVVQRLDSHKITLTLALQTFAQRNDIKVDEQLSQTLAQIARRQENTGQELKEKLDSVSTGLHAELGIVTEAFGSIQPAQERLGAGLSDLHGLVSEAQTTMSDQLGAINFSLSQMRVDNNRVRSSTILEVPTEDVLARMFRAQLQRVVVPTVQQCFNTMKKSPDQRLDEMMRKIDEMAQQLGSMSSKHVEDRFKPSSDHFPEANNEPTHARQDMADLAVSCSPEMTAFDVAKRQNKLHGRHIRHWRRSWILRWTIGTLWVTVSTTTINRRMSPEFRIGVIPSSQKAYRVTIEFIPAQSLVQLRGLALSVANTQDPRGYSQICPFISTFAVVPYFADIMLYAISNNVEGIRYLFERGLAAPSDRDEWGNTPLMCAAHQGAFEACRLLLDEGSDPLAIDVSGYNSFDWANRGFFDSNRDLQESFSIDRDYTKVVELLLQAESSVIEDSDVITSHSYLVWQIVESHKEEGRLTRTLSIDSPYLQRLKESGFTLNDDNSKPTAPHIWFGVVRNSATRWSSRSIETTLRILLDLGADICAVDSDGFSPLHYMFTFSPYDRNEAWFYNTLEVATALLKNGADPYALNWYGRSVFDYAEDCDQTPILLQSLERAGYDIEEVQDEIGRRQWCFNNPGHGFAETTALDDAQIAPPSAEGLILRKGIRGDRLEE